MDARGPPAAPLGGRRRSPEVADWSPTTGSTTTLEVDRRLRQLRVPYEEARSRLRYGERLRRAGRRFEARVQPQDALPAFAQLRTEPWAERTRAELRASGETLRARGESTGIDELTPQELQVALTVVTGMTNEEAAARLFLSTKTSEAHLHRTYRRLGISSRHECERWVGAYRQRRPVSPVQLNAE